MEKSKRTWIVTTAQLTPHCVALTDKMIFAGNGSLKLQKQQKSIAKIAFQFGLNAKNTKNLTFQPTNPMPTKPSKFATKAAKAISKQQYQHPERLFNTVEERADIIDQSFSEARTAFELLVELSKPFTRGTEWITDKQFEQLDQAILKSQKTIKEWKGEA